MLFEGIDPVIIAIGPLELRWYGLMMAVSFTLGIYYFIKNGKKEKINEDFLFYTGFASVITGLIGARLVFVLTNIPYFLTYPELIIRIDRGGLAFYGGLLGGILGGWFFAKRHRVSFPKLLDLAVPGIAIGLILVRIANIFNQEVLGRTAFMLPFERHPAQIYGALIGLTVLLIHNYLARSRKKPPGILFWSFVLYYSLLRGVIEETFRENPLYVWLYVNESWGFGFFTLTHLVTPFLVWLAWRMINNETKKKKRVKI